MNTSEIQREINVDLLYAQTKAEFLKDELRRKAIKSSNKSAIEIYDWVSPKRNQWLIKIDHWVKDADITYVVEYYNQYGLNVNIILNENDRIQFTAHFLKRFRERFIKQDFSGNKLVSRFLLCNLEFTIVEMGTDENGNTKIAAKYNEGIDSKR